MQQVSCPGCGAPVEFKSHASVMAVCEFCRTTVVKEGMAADAAGLGKLSAVLEDYSPIQIGTAGSFAGRAFTVVGRIQLRYSAGLWNEWFLAFDDGGSGWLGDSSGRYVVTVERELGPGWPAFDAIRVGHVTETGAGPFIASEKRVARCIGGQGELPMRVGDGWEARVADFRRGTDFITLDYSDGDTPTLYLGAARTLQDLQCQLLRDDEAIKASAGKYRGRIDSLSCPRCGTAIAFLPGATPNVVCQSCRSELDASTPQVAVLRAGEATERHRFTLPLGSSGKIDGREVRVLGAMRRVDDEGNGWNEYLLHNPRAGFSWLVETEDAWWRADVMDEWPAEAGAVAVRLDRVAYTHLYDYTARVELALGAFNWKVVAGDTARVSEYQQGPTRLAAELTPEEFTWSRSRRVAFDQVRAWFGLKAAELRAPKPSVAARASVWGMSGKFLVWLFGLNAIPLILHFDGASPWVFTGMMAIVLPSFFSSNE
jgi:ribosomal protein S27E